MDNSEKVQLDIEIEDLKNEFEDYLEDDDFYYDNPGSAKDDINNLLSIIDKLKDIVDDYYEKSRKL